MRPSSAFAAEPLADVHTLQQYSDWMKGLLVILPNGKYEVKSFAVDGERKNVCAYGVFSGTHTGQGGPGPPTGKQLKGSDYVYVMEFDGVQDKSRRGGRECNSSETFHRNPVGSTPSRQRPASRKRVLHG